MASITPHDESVSSRSDRHQTGRASRRTQPTLRHALAAMLSLSSFTAAQSTDGCVSLKGSTMCPAFQSASVAVNQTLIGQFSFLQYVTSTQSFDEQFATYLQTTYITDKYQDVLGCHNVNYSDTSDMYARFTATVICNAMVQLSLGGCGNSASAPAVCADTCAEFAQSEAYVTADNSLCSDPSSSLSKLLRADFVVCALPNGALTGDCISGADNEPDNCGYANSTVGLCSYCSAGGINSTDTCCYTSDAEGKCKDVHLPSITATMTFSMPTSSTTSTSTSTTTPAGAQNGHHGGLTGGDIAGIVIGAIAGIVLIALLLFFCTRLLRSRRGSQKGSIFNQPTPARKSPGMTQSMQGAPQGYEVLPGGRIARMSALEGHSGDSPTHHHGSMTAASAAAGAAFVAGKRKGGDNTSSSSEFAESEPRQGVLRPPPTTMRRNGSLSSGSALGSSVPQSPSSAAGYSSPQGVASQQSEQLPFFKDYYSQEDIHPSDRVAVLWAYQPRAPDEFALERGDMLKVVGIWDDGWATGILVDERAEDWELRRQAQRDSGVSNTSGRRDSSPAASGEIKAFPLVCVCLPEHWRKTIEGDSSTDSASNGGPPPPALLS